MRKHLKPRCWVVLAVERLEDRLSPSVVTASYTGAYRNAYGDQMPGVYTPIAPYITPAGANYEVDLDPLVAMSSPSCNFINTLASAFPAWTFNYPGTSPNDLQMTVKTYTALGNGWADVDDIGTPGQVAGAIDVATNMPAGGTEIYRWIQVITTNSVLGPDLTIQMVDTPVSKLDVFADATTPYYPGAAGNSNWQNQSGFYDRPKRRNITDPIIWSGEAYLVQQTTPQTVTIFPEGFQYGWSVKPRNLSELLAVEPITGSGNPNPVVVRGAMTLTANITRDDPDGLAGVLQGYVTFVQDPDIANGISLLGRAQVEPVGGSLTQYRATLAVDGVFVGQPGMRTIALGFTGDPSYSGLNATFVLTVNRTQAHLDLGPNTNPSVLGQPVTLTANLSAFDTNLPIPTGSVTFMDGPTTLGMALVTGGMATIVVSNYPSGEHTFTANYTGDTYFDPTSVSFAKTVINSPSGNAANIAPSGTSTTITMAENSTHTFNSGNFGFTDPDPNSLLGVYIDTLPGVGTLLLNGFAVPAGQFITVAEIPYLTYTPPTDQNGVGLANFNFRVRDNGGAEDGGIDTDPLAKTITFDVFDSGNPPPP
ncbi:MAG: Ig-like domain repeat protein [Planctomycetes bacterium]|nr:Ig-like domain repeat protein [Planctomycetota bacterium]